MKIHVQFNDDQTKIISVFGGPQSPEYYKNLGTVESSDPRYTAYYHGLLDIHKDGMVKAAP
ncbi:hypothetical protein EIZ23_04055 [Escherichia coli]|nr:hypothetical protein [Escherichia coli]